MRFFGIISPNLDKKNSTQDKFSLNLKNCSKTTIEENYDPSDFSLGIWRQR